MLFNWLYRFVRKVTKPIPEEKAEFWKRRLSFAYAIIAWNAFGFIAYQIYQGKKSFAEYRGLKTDDSKDTPAQQWSKTLGIKDATVYRISGFNLKKYEIHNEDDKELGKGLEENSSVAEDNDDSN